ncbi:MAG: 2-hydroxyacid dehydrogenase [Sedimenticola sp.]|nr:2-hydroxyacid dehydrogenase [Sedimenticola sp.]
MTQAKAVFLDTRTLDLGDLDMEPLKSTPFQWQFHPQSAATDVGDRIREARVVVSNKAILTGDDMRRSPDLKLICVAATGTNNVDLQAANELGIAVTNVTGYGTATVAQHTFGLILALSTRLLEYQAAVRRGDWSRSELFCLMDYPIREIAGKTLGIVGYGTLGRGVARIAEAFDMRVLLAQRPGGEIQPGRLALEQLLPRVDVLSLHCPLTEHTRNLIGPGELALMRPDALLLNTARGGIVDEEALAVALKRGKLGGAGVDVLTREPPPADHPLLQPDIPNLIVTPHNAWASKEARQRLLESVADNIRDYLAGGQNNRVQPAK